MFFCKKTVLGENNYNDECIAQRRQHESLWNSPDYFFPFNLSLNQSFKLILAWNLFKHSIESYVINSTHFPAVVFVMLYKVVLTLKSVDEILWCGHSNKSYWAVLSCGAICFSILTKFMNIQF